MDTYNLLVLVKEGRLIISSLIERLLSTVAMPIKNDKLVKPIRVYSAAAPVLEPSLTHSHSFLSSANRVCLPLMQKLKSALRKVNDFNLDARIPLVTLLCFGAIVWGLNTMPHVILFLNWLFLVFSVFIVIQSIKTGNWTKPVKK